MLTAIDLTRTDELVRFDDAPMWYLRRDDVWLATPDGVAQHWCAQAWATGFLRTEQALRARLTSISQ